MENENMEIIETTESETVEKSEETVDLETTRCLILTGAGEKSFVAGADIGETVMVRVFPSTIALMPFPSTTPCTSFVG